MRKIAILITIFIGLSVTLFSQPPSGVVQADAFAVIVTPTVVLADNDILHFGEVLPGLNSGEVILSTDNLRTTTGGVYITNTIPTSNAIFRVIGVPDSSFSITLPTSITVTGSNGGTMLVDAFTSSIGNNGSITAGGTSFSVGATLNVGNFADQPEGTYVGVFDVVVNNN